MIAHHDRRAERIGRFDIVIAVLVAAAGVLLSPNAATRSTAPTSRASERSWLGGAAVPALSPCRVLWRRVAPLAALGAALLGLVPSTGRCSAAVVRCGVLLPIALTARPTAPARGSTAGALIGLGLWPRSRSGTW